MVRNMLARRIARRFLFVTAITGIAFLLYEMLASCQVERCEMVETFGPARHTTETLRVSFKARRKILRAMNSREFVTEMKKPRPLFEYILQPMRKVYAMKRESKEVRWTAVNMIKSTVRNRDRRDAIRETWGSVHRLRGVQVATIFVLGYAPNEEQQENVEAEFHEHGDILQMDIEENYKRISEKTLGGMQWAAEVLPSNWLYSSGDDDFVLHVANFVRFIENTAQYHTWNNLPLRKIIEYMPIICIYSYRPIDKPHRDSGSKWYVSEDLYSPERWPPYCRGGWYSIPVATVSRLYNASRHAPYLHLDDVWITGILRVRMVAAMEEVPAKCLPTSAMLQAPLSNRSDAELLHNLREDELSKVLVSHKWANTNGRNVNVTQSLRETWEKWKITIVGNELTDTTNT